MKVKLLVAALLLATIAKAKWVVYWTLETTTYGAPTITPDEFGRMPTYVNTIAVAKTIREVHSKEFADSTEAYSFLEKCKSEDGVVAPAISKRVEVMGWGALSLERYTDTTSGYWTRSIFKSKMKNRNK